MQNGLKCDGVLRKNTNTEKDLITLVNFINNGVK